MVPEPPQQVTPPSPPGCAAEAVRAKVRIRFRKDGDLRLVSHRDLMKCFERMFRRAGLPVAATRGFNPKPRMVFPLSLALGVAGLQEVVELEFDAPLAPEAVHAALAGQAPPGLTILSVRRIDRKLSGQPRRVRYRVPLPPEHPPGLPERIQSLLAAPECWVERTRPHSRRLDVRPYVRELCLREDALEIDLWVTPSGAARPEEVLELLGLARLLEGAVLERTALELHDESPNPGPVPPAVGDATPARSASEGTPSSARSASAGTAPGSQAAEDEPPPTALLPGPLSFDS
jgi:radical SAM-linked protein